MFLSSDQNRKAPVDTPATRALAELRDRIMHEWSARLRREIRGADAMTEPVLIDTLPKFLDNLAEALSPEHERATVSEATNLTFEHGIERARLSRYGPAELVQEYHILRDVVLELLRERVRLTEEETSVVVKSIDTAVRESVLNFFLERTKLKEDFVASVTHDLRNPLSAAKLSAELILSGLRDVQDPRLADRLRRLAERAVANVKRADRMIQDMLDANQLQSGEKMHLRLSRCNARQVLLDVIENETAAEAERIRCRCEEVSGYWDEAALRRALENLVINALKYGEEHAPVSIVAVQAHGRLQISVHNEGPSISTEDQARLFEPYRRTNAAIRSGKKGWGLGLTLVKGVAHAHGGSLLLDSSPHRGTTFTLDLPLDARPYVEKVA